MILCSLSFLWLGISAPTFPQDLLRVVYVKILNIVEFVGRQFIPTNPFCIGQLYRHIVNDGRNRSEVIDLWQWEQWELYPVHISTLAP